MIWGNGNLSPLLRFWKMDPWLLRVLQLIAVTVWQFNMNSGLFSPVAYAEWPGLSCSVGIIVIGAPPWL